MTELDFDELDKAVNNLMADVNATKRTPESAPEDDVVASIIPPKPATEPTVTPSEPSVAVDVDAVAEQPQQATQQAAERPLAVKRRGRFMDVVHPSSDMKPTGVAVPKREGVSITPPESAPVADIAPVEQSEATDVANFDFAAAFDMESTKSEAQPASPAPVNVEPEVKNEWPDPIEFTQSRDKQNSEQTSAAEPHSEVPADVVAEVAAPATEQPLTSPFLADAKVEKRPLGGVALPATEEAVAASDEQTVPQPDTLPDELQTDVMSLESSDTHTADTSEGTTAGEQETVAPEPTPIESEKTQGDAAVSAQAAAGGSIAQQYAEQPSTSDQTSGAIYDTATYHQPLEHPEAHKSGWTWIIWILLLLIAGAAAGAAYFYFTTQA